eukprot:356500-Chlamydomonas_euryale.AAC.11
MSPKCVKLIRSGARRVYPRSLVDTAQHPGWQTQAPGQQKRAARDRGRQGQADKGAFVCVEGGGGHKLQGQKAAEVPHRAPRSAADPIPYASFAASATSAAM